MGSVTLPTTGLVYVDANIVIYTVEKHPRFGAALRPLWVSVDFGHARVMVSELILLEALVGPYQTNDQKLAADYESFLRLPGIQLVPISTSILREAARLRAQMPRLRPPDAIHAASASIHGADSFLTNDVGFRNVPSLNVTILNDVIGPSPNP